LLARLRWVVSHVPARALQDERSGRQEPAHPSATDLAHREGILGDALSNFELPMAGIALILVRRHELQATGGGLEVSTHARLWWMLLAVGLLVSACATTNDPTPEKRLQARAAYERGLSHMREQRPALALTALQEATSLDATEPLYQHTLGLLFLQLRRPDLALERFQEAHRLDPSYAEAHLVAGTA